MEYENLRSRDNYENKHKNEIEKIARRERYLKRKRQVMINRCVFGLILLFLLILLVKFGMFACNSCAGCMGGKKTDNTESETPTDEEVSSTPVTVTKGLVCIDAGHGGTDNGAICKNGISEKEDTLKFALELKRELEKRGIGVCLTRSEDITISVEDRVKYVNDSQVDLVVSLHRNTYSDDTVKGFEAWIGSEEEYLSVRIAERIQKKLEEAGISKNRGVKKGSLESGQTDYPVNSDTNCPSCLLQLGFMSNDEDNEFVRDDTATLVGALADAIEEWIVENS